MRKETECIFVFLIHFWWRENKRGNKKERKGKKKKLCCKYISFFFFIYFFGLTSMLDYVLVFDVLVQIQVLIF